MIRNRRQLTDYFRNHVLPHVRQQFEQNGRIDVCARREAWNDMIDMLERDGQITRRFAQNAPGLPNRFEPRRSPRRRRRLLERRDIA